MLSFSIEVCLTFRSFGIPENQTLFGLTPTILTSFQISCSWRTKSNLYLPGIYHFSLKLSELLTDSPSMSVVTVHYLLLMSDQRRPSLSLSRKIRKMNFFPLYQSKGSYVCHSPDFYTKILLRGQKFVVGTQLGILAIFNRHNGWGDCVDRIPGWAEYSFPKPLLH